VCLFIDIILLPLLIGANFIEYKFLTRVFTGRNTDFGEYWYEEVGKEYLITMIIFSFNPLIDFCLEYIEVSLHRWHARKHIYDPKMKRNSLIEAPGQKGDYLRYLDLHAGPEYSFHSKQASTTLLVFVTLIFGPILPLLYVVAIFAALVQYIADKVLLSYFNRLPPSYSEQLTLQSIDMMLLAPLFSLAI